MAKHQISLRFEAPERVKFKNRSVYRQRVTAFGANNVTVPEIFLHQRKLGEDTVNEFIAVCSAYDLSVYPVDAPVDNTEQPFFRLATIDILLPSVNDVATFVQELKDQVTVLINVLDNLDDLATVEIVQIPATTTSTTTTTTAAP